MIPRVFSKVSRGEPMTSEAASPSKHHNRFLTPHGHLNPVFGSSWFGQKAEAFARCFGTPSFLIGQTFLVAGWIIANAVGWVHFDLYPFILLNLAFSTQAAYAAPLILLAQTRQADRDKALTEADAQHREDLAAASLERQELAAQQTKQVLQLLEQNTELTRATQRLSQRIEELTAQIHQRMVSNPQSSL
jgi:uncharacterized membrane protein